MRCTNSTTCADSRSDAPGAFSAHDRRARARRSGKSTQWYRQRRFSASWISRVRLLVISVIGGCVGLHRAELGDGDLVLGQHLEQEGLEGLVGAVELVDQQHRRPRAGVERLQQRRARSGCAREYRSARQLLAVDVVRGFGQADLEHLPRVVPLVGGLRHVQALVALQADQRRAQRARPASWRARSCRRRARLPGTAGAAASGQEQRGGQLPVGDVVCAASSAMTASTDRAAAGHGRSARRKRHRAQRRAGRLGTGVRRRARQRQPTARAAST